MKIMKVGHKTIVSAAVTASMIAATPVLAQTANSTSTDLEEIIVTARRTEERLQDVPISMTVYSQEQLANRNITNALDLANFTPSVAVNSQFGNENASFAIRGFSQDSGTAPSVGAYFADVVAPRGPTQGTIAGDTLGPGSFFDLQNVQVLKGPQGTLFGRNTTGGAVLVVPQKPTTKLEGYGEVSVGNYSLRGVQGAINVPVSDAVRFRFSVDEKKKDGYLRNVSGIGPDDFNDVNYLAARASLVVDLTPNLENYLIASYSRSHTNGGVQKSLACNPAGYNPVNPAVGLVNLIGVLSCSQLAAEQARGLNYHDVEAAVPNPVSNIDQWQLINTTTWHASDTITIKNIASYAEFKELQRSPLFGTNWQIGTLPPTYQGIFFLGIPAVFTGVFPAPGSDTAHQSTYTDEVQLQGASEDRRLIYQAGVYFEWSDPLSTVGNQSSQLAACTDPATLNCTDPLGSAFTAINGFPPGGIHVGAVNYTAGKTTYRSRGIYSQATYDLTDKLKLTGGLRYTWDQQTNDATRLVYVFPVTPPYTGGPTAACTDPATVSNGCRQSLQEKSSKPTGLIGLDYKVTDDVLLYGKYARGYRGGGVYPNAPIDFRTFGPEQLDNYELGIKTSFRGAVKGTFNVAAFYNNYTNQQLQYGFIAAPNAPVSPTGAVVNAGKSRIEGVEVEASISPLPGLTFDAGYTYLKTEIISFATFNTIDPNYVAAAATYAPGVAFTQAPKHKASLSGNYTLPLSESIGRISLGATLVYTGEQLGSYAAQTPGLVQAYGGDIWTLPSRTLLNLNLGWAAIAGMPIDVSAFATNVTNKEYLQSINNLGSTGLEVGQPGEPRMYGLRLRYRFGN